MQSRTLRPLDKMYNFYSEHSKYKLYNFDIFRTIWMALFVTALTAFIFAMEIQFRKLKDYPYNILMEVKHAENLTFPSVVICNHNFVRYVCCRLHLFVCLIFQFPVADPGGGPWGPGPPLPPKISPKSGSFQAILRGNPYFKQILGSGPPPLGSKLHWVPLTKILDLRLVSVTRCLCKEPKFTRIIDAAPIHSLGVSSACPLKYSLVWVVDVTPNVISKPPHQTLVLSKFCNPFAHLCT